MIRRVTLDGDDRGQGPYGKGSGGQYHGRGSGQPFWSPDRNQFVDIYGDGWGVGGNAHITVGNGSGHGWPAEQSP